MEHDASGTREGAAPFDVGSVMRQVHFAYRETEEPGRFSAGHATYAVEIDAGGTTVRPYHTLGELDAPDVGDAPPAQPEEAVEGAPWRLAPSCVHRGARALAPTAPNTPRVEQDGHLAITRGSVTEHYRNDEGGIEQSWAFDRKPDGNGALRVTVPASGLEYVGVTESGLHFADARTGLGFRYGHGLWVDRSGRETRVEARWVRGAIELVVPERVVTASAYPAVLDPTISPELGIDDPMPVAASRQQFAPSVASSGSDYLVVWQDHRSGTADVFGARVSSAGEVLDTSGITISIARGTQSFPSVAWNGADYLVVWADARTFVSDIYGARVSRSGAVLDASGIAIATAANGQYAPSVASNGSEYLVAWEDRRGGPSAIYASRVSAAGAVLDPGGVAIPSTAGAQLAPCVASNGSDYLIAWQTNLSTLGEVHIHGARMSGASGALDGSAIAISAVPGGQSAPAIVSNGVDYFVAWTDGRSTSTLDIYGTRVSGAGVVLDASGIPISTASGAQTESSLSWNGTNYLVAWQDRRSGSSGDVYCARVSDAGAVLDPGGTLVSTRSSTPAVASNGADHLVVGSMSDDVYGARVSGAGAVLDTTAFAISLGANVQNSPSVAWNGSHYLVAWTDYRNARVADIYAARLSGAGVMLDPSGIAVSTAASVQAGARVASNGSGYLVAWVDFRNGTDSDVYAARVSNAGAVLDADGIAVSTAADRQHWPAVASNGTDYLVVWEDHRSGTDWDVHGAQVAADGSVLQMAISTAAGTQSGVSVASNGTDYLVVWEDLRSGPVADVYAARVSSTTGPRERSGIAVSASANAELEPSVASNGTEYFVVWSDFRSGTADIYGARVSAAGEVVDAAGIAVSTAARAESKPSVASDGADYLVVWEDRRAGLAALDLYGTRVRSGSVEAPAGSVFSAHPDTQERAPSLAASAPRTYLLTYQRFIGAWPFYVDRTRARLVEYGADLGDACGSDSDCDSGFCSDGVCCATACAGGPMDCQACSVAAGAARDGSCSALTGTACSDGFGCTAVDVCDAGSCVGSRDPCFDATTCSEAGGGAYTCSACPAGTYSMDGTGATACAPCGSGTYSGVGATSCTVWTDCIAGEHVSSEGTPTGDRLCAACEAGTYSSGVNASSCVAWTDCIAGEHVSSGATSASDRTCVACDAGTYSTTINAIGCIAWTNCVAGEYVSSSATPTSDRVCAECEAGTYSSDVNASSCVAWTVCNASEYEGAPPTATRDRVCAACTVCGAGAVLMSACTATTDTVCQSRGDAGIIDGGGAFTDAATSSDASSAQDGSTTPGPVAGCGCAAVGAASRSSGSAPACVVLALLAARRRRWPAGRAEARSRLSGAS